MNANAQLRISFVGDVALNGGYERMALENKTHTLAKSLSLLFAESDLVIGNLEGPLTNYPSAGPPWRFGLHGNPVYAAALVSAGVHAVSLANNHAMDCGWLGLRETLDLLGAAGIKHVGAGANLSESRKPLQLAVNGFRITLLAYCDVPTRSPLYAAEDLPGVAPLRHALLFKDIAAAKKDCDVLILCMHWGQENIREPAPKYRQLAHEMIAAGANIVVGHHPHVLQGIERLGGGAVAYSLGNFTFSDQEWHGTNREGEVFSMPYRLSEANRQSAVWKVLINPAQGIIHEELMPIYLGSDLLPVADPRPERQITIRENNAALKMRAYGLRWSVRMIRSRFAVTVREFRAEQGFATRLLRLRPRHIRDLIKLIAREWEQFRGTE